LQRNQWRSFDEARKFVQTLGLKSGNEWRDYCKSGKKPDGIPSHAPTYYKNKGWISWGDFLGTGFINYKDRDYLSFQEARKFVHNLGLKSSDEWKVYCTSGKKPENIPSNPFKIYQEWEKYSDWLGYKPGVRFRKKKIEFKKFSMTRNLVR